MSAPTPNSSHPDEPLIAPPAGTDPAVPSADPQARAEQAIASVKATTEATQAQIKHEVERAKQTVEQVRAELSAATDDRRGGPATSVEDAQQKADKLRQGITRDLAALQARVPETSETIALAKRLGIAAGSTIAGVTLIVLLLSKRSQRRKERKQARQRAIDIAQELRRLDLGELSNALAEVPMPPPESTGSTGRKLAVLATLGGVGAVAYRKFADTEAGRPDPYGPA